MQCNMIPSQESPEKACVEIGENKVIVPELKDQTYEERFKEMQLNTLEKR